MENFAHWVEAHARRFGAKPALVWDGGSLSWKELEERACGFARDLAAGSVGPGDRVAILLPNNWKFVVAFFGVLKLGATAAPVLPELKEEELAELLADLRPKQVIRDVLVTRGWWAAPAASAPAVIIYTSGSTGRPKGAVFSHQAVEFANRLWGATIMGLTPEDVVLGVLPYSHNYGLYAGLLAPLLFGASVALLEHFTPQAVARAIKRHGVTIFPGVATMFRRVLNSPGLCKGDLSTLRFAVSGAAPCVSELCAEWRDHTDVRILCGYGATEVPRTISYCANDSDELSGAAGRLLPGVEIRVVDEEGNWLAPGEVGELWIKSPAAMEGYFNRPEETREVLRDGWFRSGDLGAVLPDGFVQLVGRKRERILRGGYSVFPQEVEAVLAAHPAVAEAAVVGVPHADLGEEVAAFVALKAKVKASSEELISHCKQRLAHYKYPRRIAIVDELPRGPTGKVRRAELQRAAGGL